jgi:hypothetical protein
MQNWKKKILSLFAVLAFCAVGVSAQQFTFTTTTLSAALGYVASGNQNIVQLASVSGVVAQTTLQGVPGNGSMLYVDRELMQVQSIIPGSTSVVVTRGVGTTQASTHISGAPVIIGYAQWFQAYDPEGGCTATQLQTAQWLNVKTSNQWTCSAASASFAPQVGNPGVSGTPVIPGTAVASAGTITPSAAVLHVTGNTAIVTITPPAGLAGGTVTIIFDAVETWTAAGNIFVAGTNTTAGTFVQFVYDKVTAKWYPSRIA